MLFWAWKASKKCETRSLNLHPVTDWKDDTDQGLSRSLPLSCAIAEIAEASELSSSDIHEVLRQFCLHLQVQLPPLLLPLVLDQLHLQQLPLGAR